MELSKELRFEELEAMDAPDFWTWYAAVKVGVVVAIIGIAAT